MADFLRAYASSSVDFAKSRPQFTQHSRSRISTIIYSGCTKQMCQDTSSNLGICRLVPRGDLAISSFQLTSHPTFRTLGGSWQGMRFCVSLRATDIDAHSLCGSAVSLSGTVRYSYASLGNSDQKLRHAPNQFVQHYGTMRVSGSISGERIFVCFLVSLTHEFCAAFQKLSRLPITPFVKNYTAQALPLTDSAMKAARMI